MSRFSVSLLAAAALLSRPAAAQSISGLGTTTSTVGSLSTLADQGYASLALSDSNTADSGPTVDGAPGVFKATSPGWGRTDTIGSAHHGNSIGQPNFIHYGDQQATEAERMDMIFNVSNGGVVPMSTLSVLSEEERGRQNSGLGSDSYFGVSSPHNVLQQTYPIAPVKKCKAASTDTTQNNAACELFYTESDCETGGCVFTEQSANGVTVTCSASATCSTGTNDAECLYGALKGIDDKKPTGYVSIDTSCVADETNCNTLPAICSGGTTCGDFAAFCGALSEWECKSTGTAKDPRYTHKDGAPANLSETEFFEQVRTCYVQQAPSLTGTQAPGAHPSMSEHRTPLYANPQWPKVLGDANTSVKTSALKGSTMADTMNRGDPYETKNAGASGNAEKFKFDGYVPDMTYVRPEYDVQKGGYDGMWNGGTLRINNPNDINDGYVTWWWDDNAQEYKIANSSLVMVKKDAAGLEHRRVIQPDPDAVSRSQRQVSLDTMLQFADAIGITAVDNEQALYEWKLDALQTLLDRINTSHKATAFTYAATGHQLLNLLERFQAHSGATDDLLYYIVTVFSNVSDTLKAAVHLVSNVGVGANASSASPDLYIGSANASVPGTTLEQVAAAQIPGSYEEGGALLNLPRPPKAFNPEGDGSGTTRVYNPRFITAPSNRDTLLSRLQGDASNGHQKKYKDAEAAHIAAIAAQNAGQGQADIVDTDGRLKTGSFLAPGVPNLSSTSNTTAPSKTQAYIESLAYSPDAFRADGMNSSAPEPGATNALLLNDLSLAGAATVTFGNVTSTADTGAHRAYTITTSITGQNEAPGQGVGSDRKEGKDRITLGGEVKTTTTDGGGKQTPNIDPTVSTSDYRAVGAAP